MELNPIAQRPLPRYPERRRAGAAPLLRRVAAVALSAGALWLAGCDLPNPFEPRISGVMMPPNAFTCSDEAPEAVEELAVPGYFEGELCGTSTAWATFTIEAQQEVRFSFPYDVQNVSLDIISPDDEVVGQLSPEVSELLLTLEPGRWLLTATPDDPEGDYQYETFSLSIETAGQ